MGRAVSVVTCLAVALAGCQVSTAPKTVVAVRDSQTTMIRAAWNGQYTLYHVAANNPADRTVVQAAHLSKGDPLGFRRRDRGVVAVAGDWEGSIDAGSYEWVMRPDPGQVDPVATAVLIAAVVVVGVTLTIVVVGTQFRNNFGIGG